MDYRREFQNLRALVAAEITELQMALDAGNVEAARGACDAIIANIVKPDPTSPTQAKDDRATVAAQAEAEADKGPHPGAHDPSVTNTYASGTSGAGEAGASGASSGASEGSGTSTSSGSGSGESPVEDRAPGDPEESLVGDRAGAGAPPPPEVGPTVGRGPP